MKSTRSKRYAWAGALTATLLGISALSAVRLTAAPKVDDDTSDIMRKKLVFAQRVMEGLSLEDFDKVKKSANELQLLTQEARWRKIQSPKYNQISAEFSSAVARMGEMADKKNLDGATLGFVQMTMTCVECHKVVRGGEKVAAK